MCKVNTILLKTKPIELEKLPSSSLSVNIKRSVFNWAQLAYEKTVSSKQHYIQVEI